jgi:hypothetical protein
MTWIAAIALVQAEVELSTRPQGQGFELTVSIENAAAPDGAVLEVSAALQTFWSNRQERGLLASSKAVGLETVQLRRRKCAARLSLPMAGSYAVTVACRPETQVDPRVRAEPFEMKRTVVAGSCDEWRGAVVSGFDRIDRWSKEVEALLAAEPGEGLRGRVERLAAQIEREPSCVLTGSQAALSELLLSLLCVVSEGRLEPGDVKIEPGSDGGYFSEKHRPERQGRLDKLSADLRALRGLALREAEAVLLRRADLGLGEELLALAEGERELTARDRGFSGDSIRRAAERLEKEPDEREAVRRDLKARHDALLRADR